ncbi:maleylpyruvate isomerase family mycothiol-dependent enzyme [Nocardioides alcanivorans]|uniref:maleylpyruvate isomerase family mycothiol-dependent enzyme n=1 Tax=Nocardioides alcanivorans TaxID=2897352 RepID=UPI001F2A4535|nr:maleylpyruvate isomerase family mycothiol-dependent enzyme [Nocardioides alcanivorans]
MTSLTALSAADDRWFAVVSTLTEEELRAPSSLPGWTRAHVVAHVALNGEAFRRVLTQVLGGDPASMYDSNEARDHDIAALSSAPGRELVQRSRAVAAELPGLFAQLDDRHGVAIVHRLPGGGGMTFPATDALPKRLSEVWIHLTDLGVAGVTHRDWPTEFATSVVNQRAPRHDSWAFAATDTGAQWGDVADADLTISGSVSDLAWWLTGRGSGEGLGAAGGELPGAPAF